MPVSPDYAEGLAKALLEVYTDAEEQLLATIARRLSVGADAPNWAEQQLLTIQNLRAQTRAMIAQLQVNADAELVDAILTAYNRGTALAGADLQAMGTPPGLAFGGVDPGAVTALVDTAKVSLGAMTLPIQSAAETVFASVVQETAGRMLAGAVTRREASAGAMLKWADRGVTGFRDRAGRNWSMSAYAEMIARTAASQAVIAGHVDRLVDNGHDLAIVSDAPEECEKCRPWEGRIVSLSGRTLPGEYTAPNGAKYTVKGTLAQATADGLFHPNAILGDHLAGVLGDIENAARGWYVGPSIHLTTSGDKRLTVSPNHPVLTARGWVAAGKVRKGDKVFRRVAGQRDRVGTPTEENLDHPPVTFEQVFDALATTGRRTSVAAAADDFHGDGRHYEGEVQVVWSYRFLLDVADAVRVEQRRKFGFVRPDVQVLPLPRLRAEFESPFAVGGPVTRTLPDGDAPRFQSTSDGRLADSESARDVLARLPVEVAPDEVVDVERGWYTGHCFDLQTSTGAYLTADIVVHNCRHRTGIYVPGLTQPMVDTEDPKGDALRQEQRKRERDIRALKTRARIAEELHGPNSGPARAARAATKTRAAEFKAWREANGRKDLAYRTNINPPRAKGPEVTRRPEPTPAPQRLDGPGQLLTPEDRIRNAEAVFGVGSDEALAATRRFRPQQVGKGRKPRALPADVLDYNTRELRRASDADLEDAMRRGMELDDHPGLLRVMDEVDRRDDEPRRLAEAAARRADSQARRNEAAKARRAEANQAKWDEVGRRIDEGEDPYSVVEEVIGTPIETQLKAEAFGRLKHSGARGNTLDEMIRNEYADDIHRRYIEAEGVTRGHMLNHAGEMHNARYVGQPARQIDPRKLFMGPESRARKWASDELLQWWDENGRPTLEDYRHEVIHGSVRSTDKGQDFLQ